MTPNESGKAPLDGEDKQLVDLVTSVLVDPNIHTDTRMRLFEEISRLLRVWATISRAVTTSHRR